MDTCKICGRKCRNKGLTTIGGQKACSIHCAINIIPLENDKCSQCGSPVFINDMYKINGLICCSLTCKEEAEQKTKIRNKKKTKKKKSKSDFLEPFSKNDNENEYQNYFENNEEAKNENSEEEINNNINKSNNKNNNFSNINIGPTNYALGPRDFDTNDYDVGPEDKTGNLYHGDSNFKYNNNYNNNYSNNYNNYSNNNYNNYSNNNYNNYKYNNNFNNNENDDDEDEEDEAYGDYDESNYIREYGEHNYVQKNDGKSGDHMKELGIKLSEKKDKPKNEVKQIIHQGNDINCDYCGFSIKAGTTAFLDNFGKIFDTSECFSNHFQGIPKPNFG